MNLQGLIYCCGCTKMVEARLTNGAEIYPHREDLSDFPFWRCDTCRNYVGCHHKTKNHTNPLGNIPTEEVRRERKKIHALIDPLWREKKIARTELYWMLSKGLGKIKVYHTAEIASLEEAKRVYALALKSKEEFYK